MCDVIPGYSCALLIFDKKLFILPVYVLSLRTCFYVAMPMCCCAIGCRNVYFSGCGRTFHQLPTDPLCRQEWVARLMRADWCPTKYSVVCSDHFTADSFVGRALPGFFVRRRLKPGAVPTVFPVEQMVDNSRLHNRKIFSDLSWLDEVCFTTGSD